MKNWSIFNLHNFIPIIFFILGLIAGLLYPTSIKPTKNYPIEVSCYWETEQAAQYPTMDADSVKGDTIYKNGISIINKNIKNVLFK